MTRIDAIAILQVGIISLVGILLARDTWKFFRGPHDETDAAARDVFRGLRLRHFLVAIPLIILVVGTLVFLYSLHPILQWGWWSAIGGEGNVIVGNTENDSLFFAVVPVLFCAFLFVLIPRMAYLEEGIFRRGSQGYTWLGNGLLSLLFGLIHMLMGIPLSAAIAIAVAGFAYHLLYLRAFGRTSIPDDWVALAWETTSEKEERATREAARYHAAFNYTVVFLASVILVVSLF